MVIGHFSGPARSPPDVGLPGYQGRYCPLFPPGLYSPSGPSPGPPRLAAKKMVEPSGTAGRIVGVAADHSLRPAGRQRRTQAQFNASAHALGTEWSPDDCAGCKAAPIHRSASVPPPAVLRRCEEATRLLLGSNARPLQACPSTFPLRSDQSARALGNATRGHPQRRLKAGSTADDKECYFKC